MPAVTADTLTLTRLPALPQDATAWRDVVKHVVAQRFLEGEGFAVRRPFPSATLALADPFLLLDHMGAVEYAPGEAKGAPWHPHRGFETVTYMIDGAFEHTDSTGGGGLITNGSTQWMTAGSGVMHSELPTAELVAQGGLFHGVQLWVNLPRADKWAQPRYQDIGAHDATLLSTPDGGALVRLIAGDLAGHAGHREQRLEFAGKQQPSWFVAIDQRLLAESIAGEKQPRCGATRQLKSTRAMHSVGGPGGRGQRSLIPDREREHPSQAVDAGGPELFVRMHDRFSVAGCAELVPALLQLVLQVAIVVDLAVEDDPDPPIFIAERLMSAGQIDNREATKPERGLLRQVGSAGTGRGLRSGQVLRDGMVRREKRARIIGPAMHDRLHHLIQLRQRDRQGRPIPDGSGQSAHGCTCRLIIGNASLRAGGRSRCGTAGRAGWIIDTPLPGAGGSCTRQIGARLWRSGQLSIQFLVPGNHPRNGMLLDHLLPGGLTQLLRAGPIEEQLP